MENIIANESDTYIMDIGLNSDLKIVKNGLSQYRTCQTPFGVYQKARISEMETLLVKLNRVLLLQLGQIASYYKTDIHGQYHCKRIGYIYHRYWA